MNHKSIIKFTKKFFFIISFIFAIIITILSSLNIIKYPLYKDYYSNLTKLCKNPGLNDGYVPQGIAVSDDEDLIISSLESDLYDKWYKLFYTKIEEKYGNFFKKFKIRTLAQENARYIVTAFMPTKLIYTTSLRQINYLASWFEKYQRSIY